jgi:hypothetical protein
MGVSVESASPVSSAGPAQETMKARERTSLAFMLVMPRDGCTARATASVEKITPDLPAEWDATRRGECGVTRG